MIHIKETIIVEGKYDKIKLSSFVDALIIETNGFQIFKDPVQMKWIRDMAKANGILILTDSDSAGFLIRNYLQGSIPLDQVKHAYIPDVFGREPRKKGVSKEGKLGVEGIKKEFLIRALQSAGVCLQEDREASVSDQPITKADLYMLGLIGQACSREKRKALLKQFEFPELLSTNAMLRVLNQKISLHELCEMTKEIDRKSPGL